MKKFVTGVVCGFWICPGLWAQITSTSQISGVVQDTSGLAVPGVLVTLTNTQTGATRTFTTGADGSGSGSRILSIEERRNAGHC